MNFSPAVKEMLALHEIFRRLGFLANDLYVDIYPGHVQFCVRHGGQETVPVFAVDINEEIAYDFDRQWIAASKWWNAQTDQAGLKKIYENSAARRNVVQLLAVLAKKGMITNPDAAKELV